MISHQIPLHGGHEGRRGAGGRGDGGADDRQPGRGAGVPVRPRVHAPGARLPPAPRLLHLGVEVSVIISYLHQPPVLIPTFKSLYYNCKFLYSFSFN